MRQGNCRLCGQYAALEESHVLPAFVFRWLKRTSATGFLRHGRHIQRRVQDGEKRYCLGRCCEDRISQWETAFSEKVFSPLIKDGGQRIRYGPWMLKYCVSVSWRVLSMLAEDCAVKHFTDAQRAAIPCALAAWSGFLLGTEPTPGPFEQHLLPLDSVGSTTARDVPTNINRYFLRACEVDLGGSNSGAFVYSKFGKFVLVGFIDMPKPREWVGTKVHVREGHVGQGHFTLPMPFGQYLFARARRSCELTQSISQAQRSKIDASYAKYPSRVAESDTLKALRDDVALFGDRVLGEQAQTKKR